LAITKTALGGGSPGTEHGKGLCLGVSPRLGQAKPQPLWDNAGHSPAPQGSLDWGHRESPALAPGGPMSLPTELLALQPLGLSPCGEALVGMVTRPLHALWQGRMSPGLDLTRQTAPATPSRARAMQTGAITAALLHCSTETGTSFTSLPW